MFEQLSSTSSIWRLQPQHRPQKIDTKWLVDIVQNMIGIQSLLQIPNILNLDGQMT